MQDLNQRVSKIEVLLQKINFLVSNVKNNSNENIAEAEFRLIQSYIAELHEISRPTQSTSVSPMPTTSVSKEEIKVVNPPAKEEIKEVIPPVKVELNKPNDQVAPKFHQEKEMTPSINGTSDQPTLNEMHKHDEKDLVETVVTSKISDLKTAIDINQKFAYINELFDGDVDSFSQALNKLNSFSDLASANQFLNTELKNKFSWDDEPALTSLQDFITRRYS